MSSRCIVVSNMLELSASINVALLPSKSTSTIVRSVFPTPASDLTTFRQLERLCCVYDTTINTLYLVYPAATTANIVFSISNVAIDSTGCILRDIGGMVSAVNFTITSEHIAFSPPRGFGLTDAITPVQLSAVKLVLMNSTDDVMNFTLDSTIKTPTVDSSPLIPVLVVIIVVIILIVFFFGGSSMPTPNV